MKLRWSADGRDAFVDFFTKYCRESPDARVRIVRIVAEGDLVVVHAHSTRDRSDRGHAVVDLFRVAQGRIVEPWDVMQPVPERMAHGNGMF
jgi:predicted SnoaL-like aldol condensation-catalyzing enzyme